VSKESRANLFFAVLFVLISIPGLVMLVRKMMDPERGPMWMPPAMHSGLVYIDTIDAPPNIKRFAPARTTAWVRDLVRQRFGPAAPPTIIVDGDDLPVMSEGRLAQLVGREQRDGSTRIAVLFWNLPRESTPTSVQILRDDAALSDVKTESIEVPQEIKRDLQESGIPAPPLRVQFVTATLNGAPSGNLSLRCEVDGTIVSDTLLLRER
jgi:hypothetical protein